MSGFKGSARTFYSKCKSFTANIKVRSIAPLALATAAATVATLNKDSISEAVQNSLVAHAATMPNPDFTKVLSASSIATHIQSTLPESAKVVPINRGSVAAMHVAQYNANATIEDTYQFAPALYSDEGSLFGVFDGHGGTAASYFCRDELLQYLDLYKHSSTSAEVVDNATIMAADDHFLTTCVREQRLKDGIAGACIALMHVKDGKVRTASAGDCRVIVGRYVPAGTPYVLPSRVHDGPVLVTPPMTSYFNYEHGSGVLGWFSSPANVASTQPGTTGMQGVPVVPVELAAMHQIDFNHYETLRLLHGHPNEADIVRHSRVKGGLQPTRGFGDGAYKRREIFEFRYATRDSKRNRAWSPPYTTSETEISLYSLAPTDRFVVLSSDGLLEDMSPDMVVKYVSDYLEDGSVRSRYPNCAHYLIEKALLHASQRAIGKRKDEHNLSWVASLTPGDRRNVHDDVTAMVVFLEAPENRKPETRLSGRPSLPPTLAKISGKANL